MDIVLLQKLIITQGIPVVISIIVIFLLFRYFFKQINKTPNLCKPEILKKLDKIDEKIDDSKVSLGIIKGFLSSLVSFRNGGTDE